MSDPTFTAEQLRAEAHAVRNEAGWSIRPALAHRIIDALEFAARLVIDNGSAWDKGYGVGYKDGLTQGRLESLPEEPR